METPEPSQLLENKEIDEEVTVDDETSVTDYGDEEVDEPTSQDPPPADPPTKSGHSGRNVLSGVKPLTPEEQKERVSKSKSTPKGDPGRVTEIENELKRQKGVLNELNTNITKMMFVVVVLSLCLAAFKAGSLIHVGVNVGSVVELLIAVLLSYFGVNSTYKYTKEHPEAGDTREQLADATREFVEDFTQFVLVKKKNK